MKRNYKEITVGELKRLGIDVKEIIKLKKKRKQKRGRKTQGRRSAGSKRDESFFGKPKAGGGGGGGGGGGSSVQFVPQPSAPHTTVINNTKKEKTDDIKDDKKHEEMKKQIDDVVAKVDYLNSDLNTGMMALDYVANNYYRNRFQSTPSVPPSSFSAQSSSIYNPSMEVIDITDSIGGHAGGTDSDHFVTEVDDEEPLQDTYVPEDYAPEPAPAEEEPPATMSAQSNSIKTPAKTSTSIKLPSRIFNLFNNDAQVMPDETVTMTPAQPAQTRSKAAEKKQEQQDAPKKTRKVTAPIFEDVQVQEEKQDIPPPPKRRGRPPGSKNKKTEEATANERKALENFLNRGKSA